MSTVSDPHVAILLCTFNGARFLPEQLESYLAQSYKNWSLWVSDDGSRDETLPILRNFKARHPDREVHLVKGPRQGLGANFLSLLCRLSVPASYVALSDQDDVWFPEKLARGIKMLEERGKGRPTLYAAGYQHVDHALCPIEGRQRSIRGMRFRDALRRNRLCGATMILPPQTLELVRRVGPRAVPFHDWWLNQLVTGVGGDILYDPRPAMLYRQHAQNALGANLGLRALLSRIGMVANGEYRQWLSTNHALLDNIWYELEPHSLQQLKRAMRRQPTSS